MGELNAALHTETVDPYDVIPYESHAIPNTHPERLAVAALLRGLDPAPPGACRVLELGCAVGANLVAMAYHLPGSTFTGVERSPVQHAEAERRRLRLGLDNLSFLRRDLLELGAEGDSSEALGEYDYIVVHGVLSWVPVPVREAIFRICARHLAPQGVAYLSYNAMPGWGVRGQLRRALMKAIEGIQGPLEQVARARRCLRTMAASAIETKSTYGDAIREEIELAASRSDYFLMHDYLSRENEAFYVEEVIEAAGAHGLAYLEELAQALSDGGAERAMEERLRAEAEGPEEAMRMADLLSFRQFRATLFCHQESLKSARATGRPEAAAILGRGRLYSRLRPASKRPSLDPEISEAFVHDDQGELRVSDSALKACLLELYRLRLEGSSLELTELLSRAHALAVIRQARPTDEAFAPEEERALAETLLALVEARRLELRLHEIPVAGLSARPAVEALTRMEAEISPWVTDPLHRSLPLDRLSRELVRWMDGLRDGAALRDKVRAAAEAGELTIEDTEGAPVPIEDFLERLPALIEDRLQHLAERGLLKV